MADVVIIGAGLAGLNAARLLHEADVDVEIFEATERVGGRARTCHEQGLDLPIELGPEFVHGAPDETRALIGDPSIEIVETHECYRILQGNQLVPSDDVWQRFGELLSRAGQRSGESAKDYIERVRMSPDDAELFGNYVEGFYGADLAKIDIASVAEDAGGAGGEDSPSGFYIRNGYGSVVDSIAARIPKERIHLNCPVEAIDWGTRRVKVDYRKERLHESVIAERVIVTVPLGVLQAKAIAIHPAVYTDAIDSLAMGQVSKLVVPLKEPVWEGHDRERLNFVFGATGGFPTYWLRSHGDSHVLTAWAGGKHARALNGLEADALLEVALDGFAAATKVDRKALSAALRGRFYHFDYANHPYTRGAYSYVSVGGANAIDELSRPAEDRLFFAGEATDAEYEGTVAGALRSGKRAAEHILRRSAHKLAG